jgi:Fe-S-cluster containining protein
MSASLTNPVASRLCQACGLCCNGVLFHTVRLRADDSPEELTALGLRLKRKRGEDWLLQPCPAFRTTKCSIYPQRPARCRLFECRLLRKVASGEIAEETARGRIREVQQRVERLDELSRRADGRPRKGPLSKRCETTLAEPFDMTTQPELGTQREELARGLEELDVILDAEFRLPPEARLG